MYYTAAHRYDWHYMAFIANSTIQLLTFINNFFINNYNNYKYVFYYHFNSKSKKNKVCFALFFIIKNFKGKKHWLRIFSNTKMVLITTISPAKAQIEMIIYTFLLPQQKWRKEYDGILRLVRTRSGNYIKQLWRHFGQCSAAEDILLVASRNGL